MSEYVRFGTQDYGNTSWDVSSKFFALGVISLLSLKIKLSAPSATISHQFRIEDRWIMKDSSLSVWSTRQTVLLLIFSAIRTTRPGAQQTNRPLATATKTQMSSFRKFGARPRLYAPGPRITVTLVGLCQFEKFLHSAPFHFCYSQSNFLRRAQLYLINSELKNFG